MDSSHSSTTRAGAMGADPSRFGTAVSDRYQPSVPGSPLNGPSTFDVTQPP